jgi:hypothetical protein
MTDFCAGLRTLGLTSIVEAREGLAILVAEPDALANEATRRDVLRLARDAGYSHVALELDPDGAALSRD